MMVAGNRRLIAFKGLLWFLVGTALSVGVARLIMGLGATSRLSDAIPWGLWKAFNVLACIPMAAGGFIIAGIVHCCHFHRYHGIVRATVLIAFLGYMTAVTGLVLDIGKPWNIWRPLFYWNVHSPLFEVAWCIIIYATVMLAEFAPVIGERLGWQRFTSFFAKLTPVLAILAVAISTLHQSTLGTLFTLSANRVNPLWYSPLLNVLFLVSAVGMGLSFLCLQILLTSWLYRRTPPWSILTGLARAASWVLAGYIVLRLVDLGWRGQLGLAFENSLAAWIFWIELALAGALPLLLLSKRGAPLSRWAVTWGSGLAVIGLILHRANVGTFAQISEVGFSYWPATTEIAVTLGVIAALGLVFLFFAEHVKLWEELPTQDTHFAPPVREPVTGLYMGAPWLGGFRRALAAVCCGILVGLVLLETTVPSRTLPTAWPVTAPRRVGLVRVAATATPDDLFLEQPAALPWQQMPYPVAAMQPSDQGTSEIGLLLDNGRADRFVLFAHQAHQDRLGDRQSCVLCHHRNLPLAAGTSCAHCHRDMYRTTDTFAHARHVEALGERASCARCHTPGAAKVRAEAVACDQCHPPEPASGTTVTAEHTPGLALGYEHALHGQCIPCHREQEVTKGWAVGTLSSCTACHRPTYYIAGPRPPAFPRGPRITDNSTALLDGVLTAGAANAGSKP